MLRKGNTALLLIIVLAIGGGIWAHQQGIIEMPENTGTSSGDACEYSCMGSGECSNFGGTPVSGDCDTGICCQVSDSGSDDNNECQYQCTGSTECTGLGGTVTDGECSGGSVCCNFEG